MTQAELTQTLQTLVAEHGAELKVGAVIVVSLILLVVVVVFMLHREPAEPAKKAEAPRPAPKPAARPAADLEEAPKPVELDELDLAPAKPTAAPPRPVPVAAKAPVQPAKPAAAAGPAIPEDSVLRRHYLSHVRYMVEATTFPRPTDSILRRHYEQLVGSICEACLGDSAEMDKLVRRYDEHRREAVKAAA